MVEIPETVTVVEPVERKENQEKVVTLPPRRKPEEGKQRRQAPASRRPRAEEEDAKSNKITTIAIISCAVVMLAAILIFVFVLLGSNTEVEVPNLVGRVYANLNKDSYPFNLKVSQEVYDDKYEAGKIISHSPGPGETVVKNGTVYVTVSLGQKTEPVYMPSLEGKTQAAALQELGNLSLNLKVEVVEQFSETVAAGQVISTTPAKNTELAIGQTVKVYVSKGVEIQTTPMPNVVGQKQDIAQKVLQSQKLNLNVVINEVYTEDVAKGLVISTDPLAGEPLQTGQTVTVDVSMGPKVISMPDVINMPFSNAYSALVLAGFDTQNIVCEYVNDAAAQGTVVAQSVPENEIVSDKTVITLTVSIGAGSAQVKTKNVKVALPAGMEECMITVKDSQGNVVVAAFKAAEGAKEVTITLTGTGKQTYVVEFHDVGDTIQKPIEVNFDE